jgi:hypothetical protein
MSSSSGALSLADRRRAEIEAKRAKLAALKKSREERTKNLSRSERVASVDPPFPPSTQFCLEVLFVGIGTDRVG